MPYSLRAVVPFRAVAVVTALGLATGITLWTVRDNDGPKAPQEPVSLGRTQTIALTTPHDCSSLLQQYKSEADRMVGPYGLNGGPVYFRTSEAEADRAVSGPVVPGAKSAASAQTGQGSAASTPDSTTNVQVSGVDESDVMKTSGDLMVSVVNGTVRITRLAGRETKTLATWRPVGGFAQSVLLDGSKAVILSDSGSGAQPMSAIRDFARFPVPSSSSGTNLTVLDLTNPAQPRPIRRLHIEGTRSGEARLVDGEVRLAVTADPNGLSWKQPVYSDGGMSQAQLERAEQRSTAANRKLIAKSTIANWIPGATATALNAAGKPEGTAVRRPLLDCGQVAIPGTFSGLQTLALVSVNLRTDAPLSTWKAAGVLASGSTLYATADHAWLATARWDSAPIKPGPKSVAGEIRFAPTTTSTQIHLFDTPVGAQPRYVASGQVEGSLLNQFAMDEQDGLLRVATTTQSSGGMAAEGFMVRPQVVEPERAVVDPKSGVSEADSGTAAAPDTTTESPEHPTPTKVSPVNPPTPKPSEGRVSVLKVDGDHLAQVGVLTGLGVGEQIRGVRFDGDIGYVVTYRQTDPLYTVDLSDPTQPRLRGELKLPGYSAYLHPAGTGRVLGLGQDGTDTGQVTGLQLSLFDVSNLDAPQRLARQQVNGAWSDAEADHHAFTMTGNLVLIPYTSWTSGPPTASGEFKQTFDAGVVAVRVEGDSISAPTILRPLANGKLKVDNNNGVIGARGQKIMQATPVRTAVHDNLIYTLTPTGIAVHDATTLTRITFDTF